MNSELDDLESQNMFESQKMRFYGRRKGRPFSPNMQRLLTEILPACQFPADLDKIDSLPDIFPLGENGLPVQDIGLEIGFGGGEHLACLAKANPNTGFIGAEPFINGVVGLLRYIKADQIKNILIWPEDVRQILSQLPENSLGCVYILFPDPWPKARHVSRRILNQKMLDILATCLRPSSRLYLASDHPIAKSWLLSETVRHPAFRWMASQAQDWRRKPEGWPETRYMQKAIIQDRQASWFEFERL